MSFEADTDLTDFLVRHNTLASATLVMANKMATTRNKTAMMIHITFAASLSASCRQVDEEDISTTVSEVHVLTIVCDVHVHVCAAGCLIFS